MIITIGRQFGSGGKEIGEKVAQRLGYAFYDKEILTMAAENSGFSATAMQHYDEKPSGSLIYSLYMTGAASSDNLPLNQQLAFAQFNVIRKVAQGDNCVIVGRCADYVLREHKNLLTVFLHAPLDHRAQRVMAENSIDSQNLAEKTIKKQDKARADYYNFFTHKKWGDAGSAMLSIDTSTLPPDQVAEVIAGYAKLMEQQL
jgi:cytidylate kinase